jgi:hypothetical protein
LLGDVRFLQGEKIVGGIFLEKLMKKEVLVLVCGLV